MNPTHAPLKPQIIPSSDVIGAEVLGADLGHLSDEDFAQIEAAFDKHAVLCFRNQRLTEPQMIAFAKRFGNVERIFLTHYAHPQYPEIMLVSNIQENGRNIGHADAGRVWHTDMSYTERPPRAHGHRAGRPGAALSATGGGTSARSHASEYRQEVSLREQGRVRRHRRHAEERGARVDR